MDMAKCNNRQMINIKLIEIEIFQYLNTKLNKDNCKSIAPLLSSFQAACIDSRLPGSSLQQGTLENTENAQQKPKEELTEDYRGRADAGKGDYGVSPTLSTQDHHISI